MIVPQGADLDHTTAASGADVPLMFDNVTVAFGRRKANPTLALDGLSFVVDEPKIFCLLGPNGSGKTTAINAITGLVRPSSGSVKVLSLRPDRDRKHVLRAVSLVPQETALYNELTAYENLSFHGRYYGVSPRILGKRIEHVLDLVRLTSRRRQRVSGFSGGMQRRLVLARALLTEPQILLLDEPTLGVDVQSRQAIWDQIKVLASNGKTVLLTTNYMEEAEALAEQILILDHGERIVAGSPQQLKAAIAGKRVVIQLESAAEASSIREKLAERFAVAQSDARVEIKLDGDDELSEVLRALHSISRIGRIANLEVRTPSLQDVFLHFTGRDLRD